MMKRRTVLKILAGMAGAAMVLPPALFLASPGTEKYAEQMIYKELHYLNLEKRGVQQFVKDYFKDSQKGWMESVRWKSYYYLNPGVSKSENLFQLVRTYLLSSDFFMHGANINRKVNYLGLFNPYQSAMPNPFSYVFH